MERDNFYILLDLSIDPPENDSKVIWEAIQRKKAEWSRLRNHPTKGLQAQKNISLIPEIQRVMISREDRQKEALAAREILKKGKESKYAEIDRHIDILMGKGYIADADVLRLAEIHGIEKEVIDDRINAKKEERFARIDLEISLRMEKGYVTEAEIAKIAKRHAMDVEEIKRRVRCPITKTDKEKIEQPRLLDKAIEKTIVENLKVIKKNSLYEFLGLPETSPLETLQEKAALKKKELADISKKDAEVTASSILAGQCLTIFRTDEGRYAYDISLAKARRAFIDSDIDVAAIDGKIRHEYFEILIKKAEEIGMERKEAADYIKTYSKKKGYALEQKPEKKQKIIMIAAAAVLGVAALLLLSFYLTELHRKNAVKSEYRALLAQVEKQPVLEKKLQLLKGYAATHQKAETVAEAKALIRQIESQIDTRDFNRLVEEAEKLTQNGAYEKALALFQGFLEKNPGTQYRNPANDHIQRLLETIEKRDFEAVTAVVLSGTAGEKISAIQGYQQKHSNGPHQEQIRQMIEEMSDEYYLFVQKELPLHEKNENWEECVRLCQSYIDIYDNSHSDQLKELLPAFEERIRYEKVFESLFQKAEKQDDAKAAQKIYEDYLAAYPNAPTKGKIEQEIRRLESLSASQAVEREKARIRSQLLQTAGRFVEKTDGVILDQKTGLMWSLLDSKIINPESCLTYEQAGGYVKNLSTGGYRDWRLPTPDELTGIYQTPPYFPSVPNTFYWTAENHSRYADGWHTIVTVFGRGESPQWEITQKDAIECGAVRAVRKP